MKILEYPNEILSKPCEEIKEITPEIRQLAKDMYKLMLENNGIGLAANQVGHSIRLIVMRSGNRAIYLINPQILIVSGNRTENEGCLSFPGKIYKIKRPQQCVIQYQDLNGGSIVKTFRVLDARCVLHEIDHLNGKTMLDKLE